MKCEETKDKMPDFLTGDLSSMSKSEIEAHFAACPACAEEIRTLSEIWTKLGVLPVEQPSDELRGRFYTMLEAYKDGLEADKSLSRPRRKSIVPLGWATRDEPSRREWIPGQNPGPRPPWTRTPAFQFAAVLVLLAFGLSAGYILSGAGGGSVTRLSREVEGMRQTLAISLLQQPSPSDRIRGVSYSAQMRKPEKSTLQMLLLTLDNDPNLNVRLAAVDALFLFAAEPEVKDGVILSLAGQTSPLLQAALIDLLVDMREKRAGEALKSLLANDRIAPEVRKKAESGIRELGL